ncbi:winged helix-turn-helix transcriptional regulator [Mammaliicoccus sciuri]|uniref:winged helix-turn-helix transcriptional regulator n=1 Tax=Mammaliicoccus sciuri TaxID=1296 RepID=UPI001912C580|nr:helix-turn-helix transcriptional regulator [Mammaliicoccus sciuri]MCD3218856.1 hypothetical protein [Mammaliicoccus sciuri]MCJ0922479.1 hypothetical protein [Mammaliicoccus sciuri]MCJ0925022.1 hypothetical protein [Mammaliicoccus sciuri]MCJ1761374.1 hypothetical protein [Mammaliicoccus sciuri]MDO0951028.1 helix-turn-helix transcriptional regulator [Mammaliicoccus sciuri]
MKERLFNCPVEAIISLIGDKYKPIILWYLLDRKLRFNESQIGIPVQQMAQDKNHPMINGHQDWLDYLAKFSQ